MEVSREFLWTLRALPDGRAAYVRAELVSYGDGVEVELHGPDRLISRWRFVRDATARLYGARVRRELERQGYAPLWLERHDDDW